MSDSYQQNMSFRPFEVEDVLETRLKAEFPACDAETIVDRFMFRTRLQARETAKIMALKKPEVTRAMRALWAEKH